jgi:hypothetical protein
MSVQTPNPGGDQPIGPSVERSCFRESAIERVAKLLVRRGWTQAQGTDGLFLPTPPGRGPGLDSQALRLLGHARACFRCRDVLHLFAVVEVEFRESLEESPSLPSEAADVAAAGYPGASVRVIALHPQRHRSRRSPAPEAEELPEAAYAWAAATPGDEAPPELAWETQVLTLSSGDGCFLVRIFPNESGEGASAVLVHEGVSREESTVHPRPFLRIGGVEYAFDAQDVARLPAFPAETIELVYRGA